MLPNAAENSATLLTGEAVTVVSSHMSHMSGRLPVLPGSLHSVH